MEKIKKLYYNYHQAGSVHDKDGAGENWSRYIVGENDVVLIWEFLLKEVGSLTSYLVHFKDGSSIRIFNPNQVVYFPYKY